MARLSSPRASPWPSTSPFSSIGDELAQLVSASSKSLGLGAVIGIAIALWSGVRGMTGMMTALNIAYAQPERRGFIAFNATALVLTVVVFVGGLIALALVAGLPAVLNGVGVHGPASPRWRASPT